jgi:hypothetical protein
MGIALLDNNSRRTASWLTSLEPAKWTVGVDNNDGTYDEIGWSTTPPKPEDFQVPSVLWINPYFLALKDRDTKEFETRYPQWEVEQKFIRYTSIALGRQWVWKRMDRFNDNKYELAVWPD